MNAAVTGPASAWAGRRVLVAGARVSGRAVARALLEFPGTTVSFADDNPTVGYIDDRNGTLAAVVTLPVADAIGRIDEFDLVIVSPGFAPTAPLPVAAAAAAVPVIGDIEFSWLLDQSGHYGPPKRWLVVTGTNGKTTTVSMLEDILRAAGHPVRACGNIGLPVAEALAEYHDATVLPVELSSFQLFWAPSLRPHAGVVLNIADDHLEWHGSREHYAAAKAHALDGAVAIIGVDDPGAAALRPPTEPVTFTAATPKNNQWGVLGGNLVAPGGAVVVAADRISPASPAGIADALAAAALAATVGVSPAHSGAALAKFSVGAHRGEVVARVAGVDYRDDSKATNPHAAAGSLTAYGPVIWLGGGQLKGADPTELVAAAARQLVGAVLIGIDAPAIAAIVSARLPELPLVVIESEDDGSGASSFGADDSGADRADRVMASAVAAAASLAAEHHANAVVLAPAAASLDMFASYAHRGRSFAAAANALTSL